MGVISAPGLIDMSPGLINAPIIINTHTHPRIIIPTENNKGNCNTGVVTKEDN